MPGGARLRPQEPRERREPSGAAGAGETAVPPLLQRSSPTPGARLSILESALRQLDLLVLSAKAREAASQPLPLAAAATAAVRRLPLPPHPGLQAGGGGGAGAFSALLSATCGGRCTPGEEPEPLQVRAILRGDGLFTRGQTRELKAEGGRASERKQQRQAAAGAGERGRGCRPPSADGEGALGEARAELPR